MTAFVFLLQHSLGLAWRIPVMIILVFPRTPGIWDDNQNNEFLRRDGSFQQATGNNGEMLERDQFDFGNTCE